ncbi:cold-shock protein [Sphingopyxis sp. XHP0097]|uniref:Cold-shock protein n=1 Tax=Sphingopyxis jiangsuensis TaxID=2871171 RepID=A0ABS7MGG8_9SPHN|nr:MULTISPECIES: cold-shock protein [Sphingopyxis]MBL0768770.1 cold-shock protein [Sphingopyxis lutea]MBY4638120.1 cold-shock protein [Sphingopyxis jiangsuensis]
MTYYGKIQSYDTGKGAGTITPDKGGDNLAFVKADLQQEAAEPKVGQHFGYETRQVSGGKAQAVKLQQSQGQPTEKQQG